MEETGETFLPSGRQSIGRGYLASSATAGSKGLIGLTRSLRDLCSWAREEVVLLVALSSRETLITDMFERAVWLHTCVCIEVIAKSYVGALVFEGHVSDQEHVRVQIEGRFLDGGRTAER